ncbi:MAG: ROK family protein [Gemmataceae bacterium]|nr:ROK family protein [Gemmata sp.]MDW8196120.1 ROK family protein [Gemmataceae bacterium]
MFLGIEIGGTKLQIGLGSGDGALVARWRGMVNPAAGSAGIQEQIAQALPELLARSGIARGQLRGVGVGFGGPTDDATQSVIKSHHIAGWDGFPLARWMSQLVGVPAVICNDADVAGLAEACYGAGRGFSPLFYITVGSGIGGGLIIDGQIYRGVGRGAGEVGHLRPVYPSQAPGPILEFWASGWGIAQRAQAAEHHGADVTAIRTAGSGAITGKAVADAASHGDPTARQILDEAIQALAEGICSVIKLLCPRRVIIGGGVSLIGEELFFAPLRRYVEERGFAAFAGLTEIVPAALGEDVVVHGAIAYARQKLGG